MSSVPSPRGGFGGLSLPKQSSKHPPKLKHKNYESVEFLSIFRMSRHPAQTQSPPIENFLATVLDKFHETFMIFGAESG